MGKLTIHLIVNISLLLVFFLILSFSNLSFNWPEASLTWSNGERGGLLLSFYCCFILANVITAAVTSSLDNFNLKSIFLWFNCIMAFMLYTIFAYANLNLNCFVQIPSLDPGDRAFVAVVGILIFGVLNLITKFTLD